MNINWNGETWYSRLFAAVFLLGIFPSLVFYLGMRYQQVIDQYSGTSASIADSATVLEPAANAPSAYQLTDSSGAPYGWQVYRNERFGYQVSYPETWNSSGDIGSGAGTYLAVETMHDLSSQLKTGVAVFAQMVSPDEAAGNPYSNNPEMKAISDVVTHEGVHLQAYYGINAAGYAEYAATTVKDGWRYSVTATVSPTYYAENKSNIDSIAKSLSLFGIRH